MRPPSRAKAAVFIATIFLAGGALGAFAGYSKGKQKWTKPPSREQMTRRVVDSLREDLRLTDQQVGLIEPIVRDTGEKIWEIHSTTTDRIRNLIRESDSRISQHLAPDQKASFEEICRKKREEHDKGSRSGRRERNSKSDDKDCKTNRTGEATSIEILNNAATAK